MHPLAADIMKAVKGKRMSDDVREMLDNVCRRICEQMEHDDVFMNEDSDIALDVDEFEEEGSGDAEPKRRRMLNRTQPEVKPEPKKDSESDESSLPPRQTKKQRKAAAAARSHNAVRRKGKS